MHHASHVFSIVPPLTIGSSSEWTYIYIYIYVNYITHYITIDYILSLSGFTCSQSPGLAMTAMVIMFGTLMVRALRPLAKDHKELENVEPEATWMHWRRTPKQLEVEGEDDGIPWNTFFFSVQNHNWVIFDAVSLFSVLFIKTPKNCSSAAWGVHFSPKFVFLYDIKTISTSI